MKFSVFIQTLSKVIKEQIAKYEKYSELTGEQKKQRVDSMITEYLETIIDNLGLNFVFKYVVKKLLIENVPVITQIVFDLIKAKIKGITDAA